MSEIFRVMHVVKKVSPTNMAWNDLYSHGRLIAPGIFLPPWELRSVFSRTRRRTEACGSVNRLCWSGGGLQFIATALRLAKNPTGGRRLVLVIHNPSLLPFGLFAKLCNPKIVLVASVLNSWIGFNRLSKLCLGLGFFIADHVVFCAKAVEASLPAQYSRYLTSRGKKTVIENGIPASLSDIDLAAPQEPRERRVILVSKFAIQKNPLRAIELLARHERLGHVVWYGSGPLIKEAQSRAIELGVYERFSFRGVVPRDVIYRELCRSEFYANFSSWEGLSVADFEAIVCGCDPILLDIPERDEITALTDIELLPSLDEGSFGEFVRHLLENPGTADQKNRRRNAILNEFSLDKITEKYLKLCRSLVGM